MPELIEKLGLDWRVLLSQGVNFLILLLVLKIFLYEPVLKVLRERKQKITEGLEKARQADDRLSRVESLVGEKLGQADRQSADLIRESEKTARERGGEILEAAREKEVLIIEKARSVSRRLEEEAEGLFFDKAAGLVKSIFVKVVSLKPEAVDDSLVEQAIVELKKEGRQRKS